MVGRLHDDILLVILSMIRSRRTLLALALVSRSMHDLIIPRFLYSQISLSPRAPSILRILLRGDSIAADTVRHLCLLEVGARSKSMVLEALAVLSRMQNLCSIDLLFHTFSHKEIELADVLLSMKNLHSIRIEACDPDFIELLRDIHPLRNICIGFHSDNWARGCTVTANSGLGHILLNSKDTLEQLRLDDALWYLDSRSPDALVPEFICPRVHTLNFRSTTVVSDCMLDLAYSFPSVRCFAFPEEWERIWMDRSWPWKQAFLARLKSLKGTWSDVDAAQAAGAHLHRICIESDKSTNHINLSYSLTTIVRALSMCAEERALPVSSLRQLAKSAPYIRYLCLRFTYEKAEKVAPAFERIIRALAPLPLAYLLVDVDPIDGRPTNLWIARILSLARRELPTLRVLRLQCGVQVMGWKVVVDELGEASWVHMTNEENSELKHIYEWEWRNIQIDETLLSQFD